jgi:hypothetical protein
MAYQILNLTLISATDLKKVTFFSRMRVYAVASISGGDPCTPSHGTQVDFHGGRNPTWNAMLQLPIPAGADTRGLALHVLLRSKAPFFGHRDVGEVFVPLNDLLSGSSADGGADPRTMSYQVRRPVSGRAHGVLYFSYKFSDVKADVAAPSVADQYSAKYPSRDHHMAVSNKTMAAPVTPYPPQAQAPLAYPPSNVSYGAPYMAYPPQPYGGYASPPPYGYNSAPPPATYGYAPPPMAAPARHRGGMGMGLGLGLLGGAVGGMMLGEEIGDFEADAAYDAGFNDGLSF